MLLSRRDVIAATSAALALPASAQTRLVATPAQQEGPYYPDTFPAETDPDLVRIAGQVRQAGGELMQLSGQVLGLNGQPIQGALVEIWQCDMNGRYIKMDDPAHDPAFQGFARTRVDAQGRYAFRTIRPVPYGGRTPHVHYKIFRPGGGVFTTQMLIAGEPLNERDFVYRRTPVAQRHLVETRLSRGGAGWTAKWDVILA